MKSSSNSSFQRLVICKRISHTLPLVLKGLPYSYSSKRYVYELVYCVCIGLIYWKKGKLFRNWSKFITDITNWFDKRNFKEFANFLLQILRRIKTDRVEIHDKYLNMMYTTSHRQVCLMNTHLANNGQNHLSEAAAGCFSCNF